jgi:hypothetical protein
VNDNYPKFSHLKQLNADMALALGDDECEQPIYELYESVEENSKLNMKIVQVTATDLDKSRNVTYKVVHTTDQLHGSISIDKYTGVVFVSGPIDYETTKWVNVTVAACDNDAPRSKSSLLHIYCQVIDQNDNAPRFLHLNTTEFRIHENNEANALVGQFRAYDLDSGEYGRVVYKLITGDVEKFDINSKNVKF